MKIDTNKSGSTVGRLVKKALYGSAVVGLAMTMGATSALAGNGSDGFDTVTPYSRVAKLPVVLGANGEIDHVETYKKVKKAALKLADDVARNTDLGEGGDWVLGGTSKTCRKNPNLCNSTEIADAILGIPSPEPIDPNDPAGFKPDGTPTPANTKKASVLDFCNEHYAKQALGVSPITGEKGKPDAKYVVNGYSHTPALPCEVSIWNDNAHIYVDMLDPNAIFSLFFTDVLLSENMKDEDFAKAITALPPKVKSEIQAIILKSMTAFDSETKAVNKPLGPKYKSMDDVIAAVKASPEGSPYKHMSYTKQGGGTFALKDSSVITQAIIDAMSKHSDEKPGVHTTELVHPDCNPDPAILYDSCELDSILSAGSSWRSARDTPLTLPGTNHIIEACSPKYAKMAMSTGLHHVTALPCEITVQILNKKGVPIKAGESGTTLVISYLDPHFMLGAMFADISQKEQDGFGKIPGEIMADLQDIVDAALQGYEKSNVITLVPKQIKYDMLP